MRIVVSGGGTAGHVSPALATCDALRSQGSEAELLYVGQVGSIEERMVTAAGVAFASIRAGKFRRNHFDARLVQVLNLGTLGPNARDAAATLAGVGDSLKILRRFRPDVVFLKGGFVCAPVGVAARLLRIPYVIHESDVTPGLTNRLLARWAAKIAVGFPVKSYHDFEPAKLVFTGNPVRAEIVHAHRLEGLGWFELDPSLPVVMVTGGSSGAQQINDVVVAAVRQLVEFCQVIHVTGERDHARVEAAVQQLGQFGFSERYHARGFLTTEMGPAFAAADVVVARAGANTIAELAVLQKPTVLIPNYEMAGHQVENARILARQGAVRVLDGSKLTGPVLVGELKRLLGDEVELGRLSRGIAKLAKADAARELATLVLEVGAHRRMGGRGVRNGAAAPGDFEETES